MQIFRTIAADDINMYNSISKFLTVAALLLLIRGILKNLRLWDKNYMTFTPSFRSRAFNKLNQTLQHMQHQ
jgi:hypothetical protein